MSNVETVKVWDPLVRLFHWSLVAAFAIAYISGEVEQMSLHVYSGYTLAGLIAFRLVWGFIGPQHARFSDFVFRPAVVMAYLRDMLLLRSRRYLGHNPAGGMMVVALLVVLALAALTGHLAYQDPEPQQAAASSFFISDARADADHDDDDHDGGHEEGVMHEVHEFFSHLALLLVVLHVIGVLVSSLLHGENLPRAMVTGRKVKDL